ncbi:adenylate kinase 7 isoform X1 [Columba livia]|uniref:adenylate kinase 7 isoform X1 n=1 Tax=Columba livia TaxID=8932 RepID=UPI000A38BB32|nr:adenylate kinase 7 [Columba livia]
MESFVLSYIAYRRTRASQTVLVSSQDRDKLFRIQYIFAYKYMSCILQYLSRCVVGASLESTEEEEAEDENKSAVEVSSMPKEGVYQIVGTLSEPESTKPYFAEETYAVSSQEELLSHLLECDIVLYNITEDTNQIEEATWAASALHREIEHFTTPKLFILISTIMTWAQSKPPDPEDPEIPFTDEDFRKRKAHPNFVDHINAEKLILKLGKTNKRKFLTYIVASGHQYGAEEGVLHYFFKIGWLSETPAIPVFGDGNNFIPTIHVLDLAAVLQNIADHRPRSHYILAVDESMHTLQQLVKCISKNVGPGKTEKIPKANAFLIKELTQMHLDMLFVDLRMESMFLKEIFNIKWVAQAGLVENIEKIVKEYKKSRGILPLKVCIHGPPGAGKSTIAEELCKHYKLHCIKISDVISESIANLEKTVTSKELDSDSVGEEGEDDEEEGENVNAAQELLAEVKESMEQNAGQLEDQYVIRFVKDKLKSMPCRNQGYVLDGFPETYDQAKDLFNSENEDEEEEIRGKMPKFDKLIIPEFVISLTASDEFLINRIINLPEKIVAGTHYTQDRFLQSLNLFRESNTDDNTVLNYFDELEIHPQFIDVAKFEDPENRFILKEIIKEIGEPRNYGLTDEEKEILERKAAEESLVREAQEKAEREHREAKERAERMANWEEWNKHLEEVKRQEQELLEAQSIPLRNYLMKNVMPTLMRGIIECCKIRPDDPVDFLAEYLFKNSSGIE